MPSISVQRLLRRFTLCLLVSMLGTTAGMARAADALIFAAASLKPALDSLLATPEAKSIGTLEVSYAASSSLARQIESGAPASIFISADTDWMDYVEDKALIVADTRRDLLGNALVLVAPKDSAQADVTIAPGLDLAAALGKDGRLAVAETASVPAGRYAKSALTSLGLWTQVEHRLAPAANVRAALTFVVRGEAPLGIVYRSDAVSEGGVRVVGRFPPDSHQAIVYPVAAVKAGDGDTARRLLVLLASEPARSLFMRYGFDLRGQ